MTVLILLLGVVARESGRPSNHQRSYGAQSRSDRSSGDYWMPAFAGMTPNELHGLQ